jgi:FkbM family methyltransferase
VKTIDTDLGQFQIDLSVEGYSQSWWEVYNSKSYEPDTAAFIKRFVNEHTLFLDVGSSVGNFTLYAALKANRVIAYEPYPKIYLSLLANIKANPNLSNKIIAKKSAVSDFSKVLTKTLDRTVITTISGTSLDEFGVVDVVSLKSEIEDIKFLNENLVIKMDIEGAEFKILRDIETIKVLKHSKAIMLVALHPGFTHPVKESKYSILKILRKAKFWARNILELNAIFNALGDSCKIYRTNHNPVKKSKAIILMLGGYYEFIIDFSDKINISEVNL